MGQDSSIPPDDIKSDPLKYIQWQTEQRAKHRAEELERKRAIDEMRSAIADTSLGKRAAMQPPELSEEVASVLTPYEKRLTDFATQRHLLATLYTLGASYAQLGRLVNRTRETVHQRVAKVRNSSDWRVNTKSGWIMPDEFIWWVHKWIANQEMVIKMHPIQAAQWLLENFPYTGD